MHCLFQGLFLVARKAALSSGFVFVLFAVCGVTFFQGHQTAVAQVKQGDASELSLKMTATKFPTIAKTALARTVESFEQQSVWTGLATTFMERWVAGKSLKFIEVVKAPKHYRSRYQSLMPCLLEKRLPVWMDHAKVFEPKWGKFVKVLDASVKEIPGGGVKGGPRYYLEARCRWERATALARFTFDRDKKDHLFITGFWLARDPKGPPLPTFRSEGYILGKDMMRLAGYPDVGFLHIWHDSKGVRHLASKKGWSDNFLTSVQVYIGKPGVHFKKYSKVKTSDDSWRVKWWFDPTTSQLTSPGQTTMIDGKRWVRYYDPPSFTRSRNGPKVYVATPGDYRISIEVPKGMRTPKVSQKQGKEEPLPVVPGFTLFSEVISIDKATSALDIRVSVPESVMQRRSKVFREAIARSKQLDLKYKVEAASEPEPMFKLKKLLRHLHTLKLGDCASGLSYKTRPESSNLPENVTLTTSSSWFLAKLMKIVSSVAWLIE